VHAFPEMVKDLFWKGARSGQQSSPRLPGKTQRDYRSCTAGSRGLLVYTAHAQGYCSVSRCPNLSVWDGNVIPQTLCNVLEEPTGHSRQQPCILLQGLACQMQEQPPVQLLFCTNLYLTNLPLPLFGPAPADNELRGWTRGWTGWWFNFPAGMGNQTQSFLAEDLLQ